MEHKLFFLESAFREEFILEFLNHSMDEWAGGFEPPLNCLKGSGPSLDETGKLERAAKIEFASSAWKAEAQPIYHTRELAERQGYDP